MTGSGVALILIPVAGTLCLIAWLALVFHAEGHPRQADARRQEPRPG